MTRGKDVCTSYYNNLTDDEIISQTFESHVSIVATNIVQRNIAKNCRGVRRKLCLSSLFPTFHCTKCALNNNNSEFVHIPETPVMVVCSY